MITTMCATILKINRNSLLVRDNDTSQEVIVNNISCACNFRLNERINIVYDGRMTMSIPPQINAIKIIKAPFNRCL